MFADVGLGVSMMIAEPWAWPRRSSVVILST